MTKIKLIALVALPSVAALLCWFQYEGSTQKLIERFPMFHPTVVRKVHKEILRETLAGQYNGVDLDESDYDALFVLKALQYYPV
jgi:hypothetical protein